MTPADRRLLRARLDVALWPIPAVLTVLAAVLAELVSRIPTDTAQTLLVLPDFGPSTALAVLSAIATGMLTFTGLVAAVILLALQFGASQLSPRLLRTLVGRSPAKWALAIGSDQRESTVHQPRTSLSSRMRPAPLALPVPGPSPRPRV